LNLPKVTVHKNGHKASPESGEAFPVSAATLPESDTAANLAKVRARRTVFPDDLTTYSGQTLLYNLSRHYIGGGSVFRWLLWIYVICGAVWFSGLLPGRWIGGSLFLAAALTLVILLRRWRQRDFVRFEEKPMPSVEPEPLDPEDKVAIYGTGLFGVEGKTQRYTWLPGFYRTFATREHALLCLVRDRRFLSISRWLPDEIGMWYAFIKPKVIEQLRWGDVHFDDQARPALAVDYRITIPPQNRFQREKTVIETLYIAAQNRQQNRRILADLLHDLPAEYQPANSDHTRE